MVARHCVPDALPAYGERASQASAEVWIMRITDSGMSDGGGGISICFAAYYIHAGDSRRLVSGYMSQVSCVRQILWVQLVYSSVFLTDRMVLLLLQDTPNLENKNSIYSNKMQSYGVELIIFNTD